MEMKESACGMRVVGQALAGHPSGWLTNKHSACVKQAFDVIFFQVVVIIIVFFATLKIVYDYD